MTNVNCERTNLKPIRPPDLRRGRAPLVVLQLEDLEARRLVEVAVVDVVVENALAVPTRRRARVASIFIAEALSPICLKRLASRGPAALVV